MNSTVTVTIESVKVNAKGWGNAKTDKGSVSVPPGKELKAGQTYEIEYFEKTGEYGPYNILSKILGVKDSIPAPTPINGTIPVQVVSHGEKEVLMARMAAQKNATLMAQAYATLIVAAGKAATLREDEIKLWIDSYRKATYEVMLKELNG